MQEIRDSFQKDLEELLLLEQALIAVTRFGEIYIQQHLQKYPNCEFPIYAREQSSPLPFKTSPLIKKLSEHLIIYNQHSRAIEEMIHTQLVQKWHDFLGKVYEQILIEQLADKKSYKALNNVSLKKIDLSTAKPNNIITKVQESALNSFNFEPADQFPYGIWIADILIG